MSSAEKYVVDDVKEVGEGQTEGGASTPAAPADAAEGEPAASSSPAKDTSSNEEGAGSAASQMHIQVSPAKDSAAAPQAATPTAAAASAAAGTLSSPSPAPGAASPRSRKLTANNDSRHAPTSVASLQSQITPACHIVQNEDGNSNCFVHVIDGTGQFSCTPVDLTYLVLHAQQKRDSSYSVVGIMGCQSGGKSTLLNLLFGTKFQEMDSSHGRSQTTKGVWMDSGAQKRDLVIMDLEGTDSGERGEDRTTFERQTSLYALAVAEVLLINMWEHDIGRYTASNYGILKTVFEVNLQLFDSTNRTVLMFIIRDHIEEETPEEQLRTKLYKEVDKIWAEIRKPEKFRNTTVAELFELKFCALPHMKLQKQQFKQRVDKLREQFVNPQDEGYLFQGDHHGRKSVPADGFGLYMEQCWQTIRSNKELNLPTQKEMLATFRCDEIIHTLYVDTFVPGLAELKEAAATELVADAFADTCDPLLAAILADYSDETKHYHAGIVAAKKGELLRKMAREIEEIFATQARKFVSKQALDVCKAEMKKQLANVPAVPVAAPAGAGGKRGSLSAGSSLAAVSSSHDAPHPHFAAATAAATEAAMQFANTELAKFELPILQKAEKEGEQQAEAEAAAAAPAPASTSTAGPGAAAGSDPLLSWSALRAKVSEEVRSAVDSYVALERANQLKKLNFHLDKVFKAQLSAPLTALLKKAAPKSMWSDIGKLYRKVCQNVVQQYVLDTLCVSYACTAEERAALSSQSEQQLSQLVRLIVDQHTGMISLHMRSKFDSLFRYDGEGRIRHWRARDNIRAVFKHARDETLQLLDLFAIFRLDEYKEADSPANIRDQAAREEEEAAKNKKTSGGPPGLARRASTLRGNNTIATNSSSSLDASSGESKDAEIASGAASDSDIEEDDSSDDPSIGRSTVDYAAVDAANIILDAQARLEKETSFRFDIEGALREAELQQQANEEKTKVPWWMIALVCFLGMDEILAVLRNPFLLVFLILVGGGAYMAHQVGALWPMITVAKATATQFLQQAQGTLMQPQESGATPSSTAGKNRRLSRMGSSRSHIRNPSLDEFTETPATPRSRRGSATSGLSRRRVAGSVEEEQDGQELEMTELASSSPPIDVDEVKLLERRASGINNAAAAQATLSRRPSAIGATAAAVPKKRGSVMHAQ